MQQLSNHTRIPYACSVSTWAKLNPQSGIPTSVGSFHLRSQGWFSAGKKTMFLQVTIQLTSSFVTSMPLKPATDRSVYLHHKSKKMGEYWKGQDGSFDMQTTIWSGLSPDFTSTNLSPFSMATELGNEGPSIFLGKKTGVNVGLKPKDSSFHLVRLLGFRVFKALLFHPPPSKLPAVIEEQKIDLPKQYSCHGWFKGLGVNSGELSYFTCKYMKRGSI